MCWGADNCFVVRGRGSGLVFAHIEYHITHFVQHARQQTCPSHNIMNSQTFCDFVFFSSNQTSFVFYLSMYCREDIVQKNKIDKKRIAASSNLSSKVSYFPFNSRSILLHVLKWDSCFNWDFWQVLRARLFEFTSLLPSFLYFENDGDNVIILKTTVTMKVL